MDCYTKLDIYICTYVGICLCLHAYVYIYVYECMFDVCMHIYKEMLMSIWVYMDICEYI